MNEITAEMVTELRLHYEQLLVVLATPLASGSPADLRGLLQEARDHIGAMPSLDSDGNDRFLSTLRLVDRIETALAGSPADVPEGWRETITQARRVVNNIIGIVGEDQAQEGTLPDLRSRLDEFLAAAPFPPVPAQPWQWQQLRELLKPFADAVTDEPEGRYVNTAGPTVEDWYALADAYAWSAPVPPQDAGVEAMRAALEFYADPDTYHAIAFLPDRPCGLFADDFSKDHGGDYDRPMPGKRAREALSRDALHALQSPVRSGEGGRG